MAGFEKTADGTTGDDNKGAGGVHKSARLELQEAGRVNNKKRTQSGAKQFESRTVEDTLLLQLRAKHRNIACPKLLKFNHENKLGIFQRQSTRNFACPKLLKFNHENKLGIFQIDQNQSSVSLFSYQYTHLISAAGLQLLLTFSTVLIVTTCLNYLYSKFVWEGFPDVLQQVGVKHHECRGEASADEANTGATQVENSGSMREDNGQGDDVLTYERPSIDNFKTIFASDGKDSNKEKDHIDTIDEVNEPPAVSAPAVPSKPGLDAKLSPANDIIEDIASWTCTKWHPD
ncbi:hypothetical protein BDR03DRAFT_985992 [Suillus americanus]|nr:hypothetical protein BDR03DRAFT_985992 [Suillus americanus]